MAGNYGTFWCTGVVLLVHSTLVVNGAIVPSFLIHSSLVAVVGGIEIVSAGDDPLEPDPASTIHPTSPGSLLLSPLSATSNASPHPVLHCRSPPVARVPAHSIHQRRGELDNPPQGTFILCQRPNFD